MDPVEWYLALPCKPRELLETVQYFGMQLGHLVDLEKVALAEASKNNFLISMHSVRSLPISRHSRSPTNGSVQLPLMLEHKTKSDYQARLRDSKP